MNNPVRKIVILGIGNVGFPIIKLLNHIADNIEIIAVARRFPKHLEEYLSYTKEGNKITFLKADVTDESSVQEIMESGKLNDISVVVSTVGFPSNSSDFNDYSKEFNTNFFGNIIPIKALLNKMLKKSGSRIIIISSTSGNKAPKQVNSYAPSKFALESFASSLQQELIVDGIFVDVIRPTNITNEYSDVFLNKGINADLVGKKIVKQIQLSLVETQSPGKKFFVPYYFFGVRFLERVFPNVLNRLFGLNPKLKRRKSYKEYGYKKVLITGGSSGLGLELARIYAKQAVEVIITGRDLEKLEKAQNELKKVSNCTIVAKQINFASIPDLKEFITEIENVDLLINNAGQHLAKSVKETTISEYVEMINANFFSPVLLTNSLISSPSLQKVVNILSTTAVCGRKNLSAYSSSKSALWAYTRSMRRQKGNAIQFLEVIPSTFKSNLFRNADTGRNETVHKSNANILESEEVARRIVKAERSGKDILFIPFKARLFLLLESVLYPIFRKMYLR